MICRRRRRILYSFRRGSWFIGVGVGGIKVIHLRRLVASKAIKNVTLRVGKEAVRLGQ